MCTVCVVVFYFTFTFSGNLALCDAFNILRIDEWRKCKSKKTYHLAIDVSRVITQKEIY